MNERIQELLVKADIKFDRDINEIEVCVMLPSDLEKFAELIIGQCLNQCYNRGMNDALYAGQLQAAAYIEEHFGVKE